MNRGTKLRMMIAIDRQEGVPEETIKERREAGYYGAMLDLAHDLAKKTGGFSVSRHLMEEYTENKEVKGTGGFKYERGKEQGTKKEANKGSCIVKW